MTPTILEQAFYSRYNEFLIEYPIETAYPNVKYNPVVGTPYIDMIWFHGNTAQASIGDEYKIRCRSTVQVNIHVPGHSGEQIAREVADYFQKYFKTGTGFSYNGENVRVTKLYFGTRSGTPDWYYIPVNVVLLADITN